MNHITIHNYEAFYLDYLEGNLSAEDVSKLKTFLAQNPSLIEDFGSLDDCILSEKPEVFEKKSLLLALPYAEELIIGSIEATNTPLETHILNQLVESSSVVATNWKLYAKTKLTPNTVTYPNKAALLKKPKTRLAYLYPLVAVAAILTLFLIVFDFSKNDLFLQQSKTEKFQFSLQKIRKSEPSTIKENDGLDNTNISNKDWLKIKRNKSNTEFTAAILLNEIAASTPHSDTNKLIADSLIIKKEQEKDQHIAAKIDSTHINSSPIEENQLAENSKTYNLKQFINTSIRKKVFKEDAPSFDAITGIEIAENFSKGLAKITNKDVIFVNEESQEKQALYFNIGKFEIYKSKIK